MPRFRDFISRILVIGVLAGTPAAELRATSVNVSVSANLVKPLTLTAKQDLDFGQVILTNFIGTRNVSITPGGVLACPAGLTCTGATRPAIYNVRGTNNQVVNITALPSILVNGSNATTLVFTPTVQSRVTLTSSGAPGNDFNVGGSIAVASTTSEGIYSGTIEIIVDY